MYLLATFAACRSLETVTTLVSDGNYPVIFEPMGQMAMTNSYMHVLVTLNVTKIQQDLRNTLIWLNSFHINANGDMNQRYGMNHKISVKNSLILGNGTEIITAVSRLQKVETELRSLLKTLPPNTGFRISPESFSYTPDFLLGSIRKKRAPMLLPLATKAVGSLFGMFGRKALTKLVSSIASGQTLPNILMAGERLFKSMPRGGLTNISPMVANFFEKYSTTIDSSYQFLKDYYANDPYPFIAEVVNDIENRVGRLAKIVQFLQIHRLSVKWLTQDQREDLHDAVVAYAERFNKVPLTQTAADYLQLDVDYVRDGNDLTAILHVPCSSGDQLLTLLKFVPAPIPVPLHKHSGRTLNSLFHLGGPDTFEIPPFQEALFVKPGKDYIAVGSNDEHKLVTSAELDSCLHINRVYVCDRPNFNSKKFERSCLGSLYSKNKIGASIFCRMKKDPFYETVFQTNVGQYVLFSPQQFTARVQCGQDSYTANIGFANKISLSPGCFLSTAEHTLSADDHFGSDFPTEVSEWNWSPGNSPAVNLIDSVPQELTPDESNIMFYDRVEDALEDLVLSKGSPLQVVTAFLMTTAIMSLAMICGYLYVLLRRRLMNSLYNQTSTEPIVINNPQVSATATGQYLPKPPDTIIAAPHHFNASTQHS